MIRSSYIHEYAPHDQFMCESHYLLLESVDCLNDLVRLENSIAEKEYFGESVAGDLMYLESEKGNIFERIGDAIISIFNAFVDLLKDTGKSIKDALTNARKKTADDKFKDAMRENPDLAKEFMQGVMSGNIKARDVKDLNALLDEATQITRDLTKGKIDKKSFNEKLDAVIDRFEKCAKPIATILGIASTALVIGNNLYNRKTRDEDREYLIKDRKNKESDRNEDREYLSKKRQWEEDDRQKAAKDRIMAIGKHNMAVAKYKGEEGTDHKGIKYVSDSVNDYYMTEATSFTDVFKKISNFFTNHIDFCYNAIKKMTDLKDDILSKLKDSKNSEDGDIANDAVSGIRKIMGVLSKYMTSIKNTANKMGKSN